MSDMTKVNLWMLLYVVIGLLLLWAWPANACEQRDPSGFFCDDAKPEPRPIFERRKSEVRAWAMRRPEPPEHHEKREAKPLIPEQCRPIVSVVGDEARSREAAELQAKQHAMKQVRFLYGEQFLELDHAREVFLQCSRSDFPITGGKIGNAADAITHQHRCKITLIPCMAPSNREEK